MIDDLMNEILAQSVIGYGLIGVDLGKGCHVVQNDLLQYIALHGRNHLGAYLPEFTVQDPMHGCLGDHSAFVSDLGALNAVLLPLLAVHLGGIWSDKCLVAFDGTAESELMFAVICH